MRAARVIRHSPARRGCSSPCPAPFRASAGAWCGPPTAEAAAAASAAQQMLSLVNAERGPRPTTRQVRLDTRLNTAATKHSQDMATNNYFSHTSRDGFNFRPPGSSARLPRSPVSENIAAGNTDGGRPRSRQWMNSAGHRRNILDCTAKDMGVGVATNPGSRFRTYWTQVFGRG